MSRQTELLALNHNIGTKPFRFTLQNSTYGLLISDYAPLGWEAQITYERDAFYHGVMRTYSTEELGFVKDARQFIVNVYESQGVEALCIFKVEIYNRETFAYEDYFIGKIDFMTYDVQETIVYVGALDTSFHQKFNNRDELALDLRNLRTINGTYISPFTAIGSVTFPAKFYYNIGDFEQGTYHSLESGSTAKIIPPIALFGTDFDETQTPTQELSAPIIKDDTAFFLSSSKTYTMNLNGAISCDLVYFLIGVAGAVEWKLEVYEGVAGVYSQYWTLDTAIGSVTNVSATFAFDVNLTFTEGNSYLLVVTGKALAPGVVIFFSNVIFTSVEFQQFEKIGLGEIVPVAYPTYEAFLRLTQKMEDAQNPFYSEFFGRTDTPLTTYASDGEMQAVTKGEFIRGLSSNNTLVTSFKDLFTTFNSIFLLGAGVEKVNGEYKIRIENRKHFYNNSVIIDLSDRVTTEIIGKKVLPEFYFNEIKIGYSAYNYEKTGGLNEFNTEANFTTEIASLKSTLDLVAMHRFDTAGMDVLRIARKELLSIEDVEGDEDIFIVDAVRDGSGLKARTGSVADGFASVSGGLGAVDSFNLRLSPKRNLLRWGQWLKIGLHKILGSAIKWVKLDKFTELVTQLTTEATGVQENADVQASDLANNWALPEEYSIMSPFTLNDIKAIEANPNGLIKLSSTIYGWIRLVETNTEDEKAEWRLLRCNLATVTPIELINENYYYYFTGASGALLELTGKSITNTEVTLVPNGSNTAGRWADPTSQYNLGEDAVGVNSFTAMMWINRASTPIAHVLLHNTKIFVKMLKSLINVVVSGSGGASLSTPAIIQSGTWEFIAISFDDNFVTIYAGDKVTSPVLSVSGSLSARVAGNNMSIIDNSVSTIPTTMDCAYSVGAKGVLNLAEITAFYNETVATI